MGAAVKAWVMGVLLLVCTGLQAASPETEARIKALQFALEQADRAQAALNTQFQMVREIRQAEAEQHTAEIPEVGVATPPRNYDDLVRARAEHAQRARQNTEELNRLYARFNEIERDKERLRDQIRQLMEAR